MLASEFNRLLKKYGKFTCRVSKYKCHNLTGYHICEFRLTSRDKPRIINLLYLKRLRERRAARDAQT